MNHQSALCRFFWALGWQFDIRVRMARDWIPRVAAKEVAWYAKWDGIA